MSTSKIPVKMRLDAQLVEQLHTLHPGYGETSRIVKELVTAYLRARGNGYFETEAYAIAQSVRGRKA